MSEIGVNLPRPVAPQVEAASLGTLGIALNRVEAKLDSAIKLLESLVFTGNLGGPTNTTAPLNAPANERPAPKTSFYYKAGDGSFRNVTINPDRPICPICDGVIKSGKGKYGEYYFCSYDKIYFNESKKR